MLSRFPDASGKCHRFRNLQIAGMSEVMHLASMNDLKRIVTMLA